MIDNPVNGYSANTNPMGNAWQLMLSGRRLNLANPSPLDIEIADIAHGLARVARWNGQTRGDHIYSVAQHSVLVEQIFRDNNPHATPHDLMMCLLHDGAEYVVGDMITPVKQAMGDSFRQIEDRITTAIHLRFGLPAILPLALKKNIKKADHTCAYLEAIQLAGFTENDAIQRVLPPHSKRPPYPVIDSTQTPYNVTPVDARTAYDRFMKRFNTLLDYRK